MSTVAMSGSDTIIINNRILNDLAVGTVAELTYPSELASVKTGKNGNSIYGLNESGRQAELKLAVIRASSDDKFLNGLLAQQKQNFAGFTLVNGQLVKSIGDGQGNVTSDTYILGGGVFTKTPEAKSNVEGEAEQSIVHWTIRFSNAPRTIG